MMARMSGPSTIGSRIRAGRVNARLTQTALAKVLGVSPQAVSQWERDQHLPGLERLSEIADRIHVSIDWLTKGIVGQPPNGSVVVETHSRGRRARSTSKPMFRRYRLVRTPDSGTVIELTPINGDWPVERFSSFDDLRIIGVMTEHTRRGRAPRV